MKEAKISEIFLSYQGEGPYVGVRQLFVRFYGCAFGCVFCDTKPSSFSTYNSKDLTESILKYKDPYHSLSLTGGEPLEQADFLQEWLPYVKTDMKKIIYLETNGLLPDALAKVVNLVDIVSMDIKLPSVTGKRPAWAEHKRFLELSKGKDVFVKLVVSWDTSMDDVAKARDIIRQVHPKMEVILQPVDPSGKMKEPSNDFLNRMKKMFGPDIPNVRVMQQYHKNWGVK